MIIPYEVRTLTIRSPWANLALLAANILMFILTASGALSDELLNHLVLSDWSPVGFIGYQFLHSGVFHLVGNMILLWVFGNALNGIMHDLDFILAYLATGVLAGALHLLVDGAPVVGASGSISGLMGLYLAVYPQNKVSCLYWWIIRAGTFDIRGYLLIIGWFLWDLISALRHVPGVACWAHVGGTLAGFAIGLLLLKLGRIHIDDYDNPTVLDLMSRTRD
jgi:membrane associated rhomboid family serine protease